MLKEQEQALSQELPSPREEQLRIEPEKEPPSRRRFPRGPKKKQEKEQQSLGEEGQEGGEDEVGRDEDENEFNREWAEEQDGANVVLTLPPARLLSVAGAVECNPVFEPAASASQIVKGLVAAIEAKEAGAIDMDEDNE